MDEKRIYQVYVDLMRLHKAFYERHPCRNEQEEFVQKLNQINSRHNSLFCYMMCESLRKWYWRNFSGLENNKISEFYSGLWHFHKEYLNSIMSEEAWKKAINEAKKLSDTYKVEYVTEMLSVILNQFEAADKC